jgi:hypothetical protein
MENEFGGESIVRRVSQSSEYFNNEFRSTNVADITQTILENKELKESNAKLSEKLQELEKKASISSQKLNVPSL